MLYRIYAFLILILSLPVTPTFGQTLTLNSAVSPPLTNKFKTGFLDIIVGESFKRNNLHLELIKIPAERGLRNSNEGIDDGIGMDEEGLKSAMEKFGQIRTPLETSNEGTGLGLPLSNGLIKAHGGTLHLESEPGVGTTVRIEFPKDRIVQ